MAEKKNQEDPYYAEEPDWMEYREREQEESLNRSRGVFLSRDQKSINTAASVFEKWTIFQVSSER